ncbi:MAG: hypothetical protein ABIP39_08775 [Polyangiaceae bacterium]
MESYETCAGSPLVIHWKLTKHLFFTWEVDSDALQSVIHESVDLVEVRPGIALLSTGVLQYEAGQFSPSSPPFIELVTVAHVQPDLSVKMPVPRFTFQSISVYSDSPEFVEQEGRLLFTPTELVPSLTAVYADDGLGVDVSDARGPILTLRNTQPEVSFSATEFHGQHFTVKDGLQIGIWQWDGVRFEHMKRGDAGKLHPHPHFKSIDLKRVRSCYRQMMGKPAVACNERFYAMKRFA